LIILSPDTQAKKFIPFLKTFSLESRLIPATMGPDPPSFTAGSRVHFPVYFHLAGLTLHPHPVMEVAAYAAGLATHLAIKARARRLGTQRDLERSLWLIAGAVVGALVGAKLLAWIESWHAFHAAWTGGSGLLGSWLAGKTIVGGLVGGWIGVEITKRATHLRQRTGDTWVYPLLLSMAIGRVGCFLTGLADQTYGIPTALPWGVDFGDGIPRHPTQLYDIAFLLLLGVALAGYQRAIHLPFNTGRLFRIFMLSYCLWRLATEFIKPTDKPYAGLSAIQVVCVCTAIWCAISIFRQREALPATLEPAP
jgi:prolipoprotein diacylglyceryltransferase